MKIWIGIDNGVSGSMGVVSESGTAHQFKMPIKHEPSYTKAKKFIHRIDFPELSDTLLSELCDGDYVAAMVLIERPMVNPMRFVATSSALRALEATLIAVEQLKLPYQYIDSKEWQKAMLPSGLEGDELKTASAAVGRRLAPTAQIEGKDCDGLLMAFYAKQKYP